MYKKTKYHFFFIYSHDKFFALLLLNPLEKNYGVATGSCERPFSIISYHMKSNIVLFFFF